MKTGPGCLWAAAILTLAAAALPAKEPGNYRVGQRAKQEIFAPVPLSVIDPQGTEALRKRKAEQVPGILCFDTNAAARVEQRFRRQFEQTRADFLNSVRKAFGPHAPTPADLASFKFATLRMLYAKEDPLFPAASNHVALWACGDADASTESALAGALRQAMSRPILPAELTVGAGLGAGWRLVPVSGPEEVLTAASVGRRGVVAMETHFVSLAQARKDFLAQLGRSARGPGGPSPAAAQYLAGLLEPNCSVDEALTRELRAGATREIWAVDHYEPGQIIARRGQLIDSRVKAALDELTAKMALLQARQARAARQMAAARTRKEARWLAASFLTLLALVMMAAWRWARRGRPAPPTSAAVQSGQGGLWRQRALLAETRVGNLQRLIRSGSLWQVARWLSEHLTQRLLRQRMHLLQTQDQAALELSQLQRRLEQVHAPIQDRLAAYEQRIAELEQELALRGAENRELLQAEIETARKHLQSGRRSGLEVN